MADPLRHQPATRLQAEELSDRLQDVEARIDQIGEKVDALTELVHQTIQYQALIQQFGPKVATRIMETINTLKTETEAASAPTD